MNLFDHRLQRLLKAASQVPKSTGAPDFPFGLDTRVLAHCFAEAAEDGVAVLQFFQRALLCSCAVMVLSFAFYLKSSPASSAGAMSAETEIADSAIETSLP